MAEHVRHQLPMSEGVFTFRVEQTENGSLVATLHRETAAWNHTPIIAGGGGSYYNRYRHRFHHLY